MIAKNTLQLAGTLVLLFQLTGNVRAQQIVINEILASNAVTVADPNFGDYSDWAELYNPGDTPVDLTGWHFTDNISDTLKWTFPAGTVIPPHDFLLLWTDGLGTGLHTGFRLSADGEEAALYDPMGNLVDQIVFGEQHTDISYGRKTDGGSPWGYFTRATPGTTNNTSTFYEDFVQQVPMFSISGGFYTGTLTVTIQNLSNFGVVRYTTDGSAPKATSPVFDQPLQITATTVVKARIFYPNRIAGPIVTNTYFINENFDQRGLPVLSLSTDPAYFFSPDSGLYVQNFKPTWEYPIHLEFYEPDGLLGFHHDAGVQIGGENAWILPEKLLNIYSRKQYGSGHFDYQLFPNNPRTRFGDIILRCSGNDWSNTLFRDGMMQQLIKAEADLDIQDFRPCAVYINGQYFGIHNIREKQDKDYIEYYHQIDPDSLDYIENNGEVKEGDAVIYQQMVDLLTAGVQSDAAFQNLEALADTRNYTDYLISEIFTANTSWGHNIALFRPRSATGQWRWLLHDYDRGFNLSYYNTTSMTWATATNGPEWSNGPWATLFLRKMLENPGYRQQFITRFADHLYITFNPATINKLVDRFAGAIRRELPYHVARWTGTTSSYGNAIPSVAFWENEVSELRTFGVQRNTFMWNDLNTFFSLSGTTNLNLEVSDPAQGFIRLHDLKVPAYPWTGQYFQNRAFTLTAEARPGFNFVRWEKVDGQPVTLISAGATWKYSDQATPPPAGWNQPAFNDAAWSSGAAQLGYGDGDEATVLNFGTDASNKTPAYYFRKAFSIANPAAFSGLLLRLKVDDGAVVYLNGQEVWRYNMPATPVIAFNDFALTTVSNAAENTWNEQMIPTGTLASGQNLLAVEVHQAVANSSDLTFDFELVGLSAGAGTVIGTDPALEVTLDASPWTLRAVFESNGSCGVLPDTVRQATTLTAACSPYIAAGDVVVLPNVTLTVEPGVEIQFPEKADLWVLGDLQVEGTEAAPVLIRNTPTNHSWGGILFKNATQESHLQYAVIKNASAGVHRLYYPAAISAYRSNLHLDHLDMTDITDNPIFSRFSDVILTNSDIKSKVTGDCINVKQGFARVEHCTFEGGTEPDMDAIDYDGVTGGIVRNNIIHDFRGDNCDGLDIGEQCQDLLIEGNFIYHCFDKGISVGQESSALVRDNTIAYTTIGIALKDLSEVTVDHCTFFGNQQGVSAYEKNPGNRGGLGMITNCIVSNASLDAYVADSLSSLTLVHCLSDLDSISTPGNINLNPDFVNPTFYNFQLQPGSPAIGAGTDGLNLGAITIPNYTGSPQLIISELLYDNEQAPTGEFLELYNPGNTEVSLAGYRLAAAIDFTFPNGTVIQPGEYIVVAKSAADFSGAGFQVFEWTDGKLKNEGEVIYLFDPTGLLVDFVRYNNNTPWPEAAGLAGRSIQLVGTSLDNHFGENWQASEAAGGTPGAPAVIVGVTPSLAESSVTVYPNPATTYLQIVAGKSLESIEILDFTGRSLYRVQGLHAQEATVNLKGLAPGMYIARIGGNDSKIFAVSR